MAEGIPINPEEFAHEKGNVTYNDPQKETGEIQQELRDAGDDRYSLEQALYEAEALHQIITEGRASGYQGALRQFNWQTDPKERDESLMKYETELQPYLEGIPFRQKTTEPDGSEKTTIGFRDVEFFRSLIDSDKRLDDQEIERIADQATAIYNVRNLLYHMTPAERTPIIAKTGLLSLKALGITTEKRYGRKSISGSEWGAPTYSDDIIDVWDYSHGYGEPDTYKVASHIREDSRGYRISPFEKISDTPTPILEYKPDANYKPFAGRRKDIDVDTTAIIGPGEDIYRGAMFVVKLQPNRSDALIRYTDHKDLSSPEWSYVKDRIKPEELIGVVFTDEGLLHVERLLELLDQQKRGDELHYNFIFKDDEKIRWTGEFSKEQVVEIIGNNLSMPVYDPSGNLLWPKKESAEELLSKALQEEPEAKNE